MLSTGEYLITDMTADFDFFTLQRHGNKPALFEVVKTDDKSWAAMYIADGRISIQDQAKNHAVAITDQGHRTQHHAANAVSHYLADTSLAGGQDASMTTASTCTIPPAKPVSAGSKISTWRKIRAGIPGSTNRPAGPHHVHGPPHQGRALDRRVWRLRRSHPGHGNPQASSVRLNTHYVFLYRPTTSLQHAHELSLQLGMKKCGQFSKSSQLGLGDLGAGIPVIRQLQITRQRLRREKGFHAGHALGNTVTLGGTVATSLKTYAGVAGAVGYAMSGGASLAAETYAPLFYLHAKGVIRRG